MDIYKRKCLYIKAYHAIFDRLHNIYDTFIDYYGESNVDCTPLPTLYEIYKRVKSGDVFTNICLNDTNEGSFTEYITCKILSHYPPYSVIFIKWDTIKVTNEYDESITIKDLYAKISIKSSSGLMSEGIKLSRRTYTQEQWNCGYSHSHLPRFSNTSHRGDFDYPCLGSGPLVATSVSLKCEFNLNLWGLFVYELDKYVRVESVKGVPYIRLRYVTNGRDVVDLGDLVPTSIVWNNAYTDELPHDFMSKFIKYFINKKDFKVSYRNGRWILGESYLDFGIKISNHFINFANDFIKCSKYNYVLDALINSHMVKYYNIREGRLYDIEEEPLVLSPNAIEFDDHYILEGCPFYFKGKYVPLKVLKESISQDNRVLLLNPIYIIGLVYAITILINTKYGNNNETKSTEEADSEEIIYII